METERKLHFLLEQKDIMKSHCNWREYMPRNIIGLQHIQNKIFQRVIQLKCIMRIAISNFGA